MKASATARNNHNPVPSAISSMKYLLYIVSMEIPRKETYSLYAAYKNDYMLFKSAL